MNTVAAAANPEAVRSGRGGNGPAQGSASPAGFEVLRGRRIYILPTRQGVGFGGMLLVMLLGSANYNNGLGYALCFLLASLALISLVHTVRNLSGLGVRLQAGPPAFAGQPARFQLVLDNRDGRARPAVVARLRPAQTGAAVGWDAGRDVEAVSRWRFWSRRPRRKAAAERDVIGVTDVDADTTSLIELSVPTLGRGWLEVERLVVATRYPFGLFRAWSVPQVATRTLVYPAPYGSAPMPLDEGGGRSDSGHRALGRDEFSGLREYVRGDSSRRIHWKALAREQGLLVKSFTGGAPLAVNLSWTETVGPTESRLSQLTRWVLDAEQAQVRFSLSMPGLRLPASQGASHREQALRALALFQLPRNDAPPSQTGGDWTGGV